MMKGGLINKFHLFSPKLQTTRTFHRPLHYRSNLFIPLNTEKKPTSENQPRSQILLENLGFIQQVASGVFIILPLGLRCLDKLIKIIDNKMEGVGGVKLSMPMLLPSSLWKATGRWELTGSELFRLKDRKGSDFCLGPTHEEIFTHLVSDHARSPKQFPLRLYQIGTKYRDEARPRFGLIRGREFVMKDMYSFDISQEDAYKTYDDVTNAYVDFFSTIQLPVSIAAADSGNIGGNKTHEFHLVTEIGEDFLFACNECKTAANVERTVYSPPSSLSIPSSLHSSFSSLISSPIIQLKSISQHPFLSLKFSLITVKGFDNGEGEEKVKRIMGVYPNHRDLNPLSIKHSLSAILPSFSISEVEIEKGEEGEEGEEGGKEGEKEVDYTFVDIGIAPIEREEGVSIDNDRIRWNVCLTLAKEGDLCSSCSHPLTIKKGIELGQVFYLGTKYSKCFNATVKVNNQRQPLQMGCYGLGVSRIISAVVEYNRDDVGLVWPENLAPYKVCLISKKSSIDPSPLLRQISHLGNDIMYDDRAGVTYYNKLSEAKMLGYSYIVTLTDLPSDPLPDVSGEEKKGERGEGGCQIMCRRSMKEFSISIPLLVEFLQFIQLNQDNPSISFPSLLHFLRSKNLLPPSVDNP